MRAALPVPQKRAGDAQSSSERARLEAAFAQEEYRSLLLAARVRLVAIAVITVWVTIENGFPDVLYFYGIIAVFTVLSIGPPMLLRRGLGGNWYRYVFPLLEVCLFTFAVFYPNPLEDEAIPPQLELRFSNAWYLFLFIAGSVFYYSPRVVLWTGITAAIVWSAATLRVHYLPDSLPDLPREVWRAMAPAERLAAANNPYRVYPGQLGRIVIIVLVVSATLAAFTRRMRALMARQVDAERQRTNLSRYFSANMVEELARSDRPLGVTRSQPIAVLFVDIVGFTRLSEERPPEAVIALLRDFHGRMQRAVFDNDGTLDKYIGDGVMATFGTPYAGQRDATRALACAQAMVTAVETWSRERARRGEAPIQLGIGVHYGTGVLGDIGGAQRFEFAVVGDVVNVAARLERLTRDLGVPLVVSEVLVDAVRAESGDDAVELDGLAPMDEQRLRGREAGVRVWGLAGRSPLVARTAGNE